MFEEIKLRLLLQGVRDAYGYDFTGYALSSIARRIQALMAKHRVADEIALLARILDEPGFFRAVLRDFTVPTTEMFRDPFFFRSLREHVIPALRTFPTLSIWVAGCSTGQELYSLAILLEESGLLDRSTIFATDINPEALHAAAEGIYAADELARYGENYRAAGGREDFDRYYTSDYGLAKFSQSLRRTVVFSDHNLVTDEVFAETQLVLCRNVLIYFGHDLQDRVLRLLSESLGRGGFLALGSKESLRFSGSWNDFDEFDSAQKIYLKRAMPRLPMVRPVL